MNIHTIQDRIAEYSRRLGLGETRAPDPLDADPAQLEDAGGFKLPANFQEVSHDARDFQALTQQPGWPKILDCLERLADSALARLRHSESADPIVIRALRDRWVEAEGRLHLIQKIISDKIAERDMMLADLGQKYGITSSDDVLSEIKQVQQMKDQLRREGMVSMTPEEIYGQDRDGDS